MEGTPRQYQHYGETSDAPHESQENYRHCHRDEVRLSYNEYTIAWICALPIEMSAAITMLDQTHKDLPGLDNDINTYKLGSIENKHNIVIACLPKNHYGTNNASNVLTNLVRTFPSIRLGLMVGIGGAAPGAVDIRLGDVVVGTFVTQYDLGKTIGEGKMYSTATPRIPDQLLNTAVSSLEAKHERGGKEFPRILKERFQRLVEYDRTTLIDNLFITSYDHVDPQAINCDQCDSSKVVERDPRSTKDPVIHHGGIASGNQVMRSSKQRDRLAQQLNIVCFEMEAAGLMNILPCLPIRGICDYSDSHKNKEWQKYAAATAAAYARELLTVLASQPATRLSSARHIPYGIPFSLQDMPVSDHFIDRPADRAALEDCLLPKQGANARRKLFILHGLGGIGKTQLAVDFARRHKTAFSAIFWLDGRSEDQLRHSLANCATRIPEFNAPNQGSKDELDAAVMAMMTWVSRPDNTRWLLIFDNVDQEHQRGGAYGSYDLRKYLPADQGAILVTTRLSRLQQLGDSKELTNVDHGLSLAIMEEWYGDKLDPDPSSKELLELLELLEGLPLALAQAGSFLRETGIDIPTYLQNYHLQWNRLMSSEDSPLVDYEHGSVATTWAVSLNAVKAENEDSVNILRLWAFINNKDLWFGLFEVVTNRLYTDLWPAWLSNIARDTLRFAKAMGLLLRYSMIQARVEPRGSYSIHPVVHRWVLNLEADAQQRREFASLALCLVGHSVPHNTSTAYWTVDQRLLPHADSCSFWICQPEFKQEQNPFESLAIGSLGLLYHDLDKSSQAEEMHVQAMWGLEKTFGREHETTLAIMNNLAISYAKLGKNDEAQEIFDRVLQGKEKVYGHDHPSTLHTISNLASLYTGQGKLSEAKELCIRALNGMERTLEQDDIPGHLPRDISILETTFTLGHIYTQELQLAKAEELFNMACMGYQRERGSDHPRTLDAFFHLGQVLFLQGKLIQAKEMIVKSVEGYKKTLGPANEQTLKRITFLEVLFASR
ncbi:related to ankyrin 3 [Fusarium proliferatum]|nr:related to ankyrin 3 [Fusarium proliferatum]